MLFVGVLILFCTCAFSNTSVQTDWSGGAGVQGPVTSWDDSFWNATTTINSTGGVIKLLSYTPIYHIIDKYFSNARSIYPIDIDSDGDIDLLGISDNRVRWWENIDGAGNVWIPHMIGEDLNVLVSLYSTDIDGDGDSDVLGAEREGNRISCWENIDGAGNDWMRHTVDADFNGAHSVNSTDVDSDGDADVIGAAYYSDEIAWWENTDGTGSSWIKHTIDSEFDGAISVYSNDIDGDGDSDVLGAAWYSDDITWWENSDTAPGIIWTEHIIDMDFDLVCSVVSTDIDGDGDADVVGGSYGDDGISWWENINDGTGTDWIEHMVDWGFTSVIDVHSADLDGDGDADIAGAGFYVDKIAWWENNDGIGGGWTKHTVIESYARPVSACPADVDGDGDLDLFGASMTSRSVNWWDIRLYYHPYGSLVSSILDAGYVAEWTTFLSNSEEPVGTSLFFLFRSSNDYTNLGAWSDTIFCSDTTLTGILADSSRFLQYKLVLETSDPGKSPQLADVAVGYTLQVGVSERTLAEVEQWSLHSLENPSHNFFSAIVSVPEEGSVELLLYDVSGRVVAEVSQELPAGTHSVNFPGLAEGVYFCTMRAGDFAATERVVVLE